MELLDRLNEQVKTCKRLCLGVVTLAVTDLESLLSSVVLSRRAAADTSGLTRYGPNPWAAGADPEFGPEQDGDYYKVSDVQALLANAGGEPVADAGLPELAKLFQTAMQSGEGVYLPAAACTKLYTAMTTPQQPAEAGDSHAFKNFHRMLCERFNYMHDEKDWRRDQVSLMEHIVQMIATPASPIAEQVRNAALEEAETAAYDEMIESANANEVLYNYGVGDAVKAIQRLRSTSKEQGK